MSEQSDTMSVPITEGADERPDTMSVPVDEPAEPADLTPGPRGGLPTSAGGRTGVEPSEPGQSLGQVPEHDDDDRDEAGDAHAAGPGTHGRSVERAEPSAGDGADDAVDVNEVR
jgi:hypothetical protein